MERSWRDFSADIRSLVAGYFLRNARFTRNNWKTALARTSIALYFAALFILLK
jgi:hypothetical protein